MLLVSYVCISLHRDAASQEAQAAIAFLQQETLGGSLFGAVYFLGASFGFREPF